MANKKSSKKKNSTLFAAACVLLGLLVILIIFLVKKDQIFTNLKETAFFDRVFGTTPTVIEKHEPAEPKKTETIPLKNEEVTIKIETEDSAPVYSEPEEKVSEKPGAESNKPAETAKPAEKTAEKPAAPAPVKPAEKPAPTKPADKPAPATAPAKPTEEKPKIKFCDQCGAKITNESAKFCMECGNKLIK